MSGLWSQGSARRWAALQPEDLSKMRRNNGQRITQTKKENCYARWRWNWPDGNGANDRTRGRLLRGTCGARIRECRWRARTWGRWTWSRLAQSVSRHRFDRMATRCGCHAGLWGRASCPGCPGRAGRLACCKLDFCKTASQGHMNDFVRAANTVIHGGSGDVTPYEKASCMACSTSIVLSPSGGCAAT